MYEQDKLRLREILLKNRRQIFERRKALESGRQTMSERDIELEEEAQKAIITAPFNQLDERETEEIEDIDLALCRMSAGTYGICESCEMPILIKRLEVFPATRLCRKCARKYEKKKKNLPRALQVITCAELPNEYRNLNDEELGEIILEHFHNDGRIDLEELVIICKKGIIYLRGIVSNESQRQIILQILTDVMGFTSVVDHLQINELPWERVDRTPGRVAFSSASDVDELSDDVFESQEKEIPYFFPDRPPSEKE